MGRVGNPQQQTLSIRISEALREYLERARRVLSNGRGSSASISEIAKMLLEQARNNPIDDGFEVVELLRNPTETLLGIRAKWEQQTGLSRAEWIVLGRYLEPGCEGLDADSRPPSAESFIDLLEALLALVKVRKGESADRDQYYLAKLRACAYADSSDNSVAMVGGVVQSLIRELRERNSPVRPVYVGRAIHVALQDEEFSGPAAINEALMPFFPALFRVAARGHWLQEHRPLRPHRKASEFPDDGINASAFKPVCAGEFRLTTLLTNDGDLAMAVDMTSREAFYPLGSFAQIREFAALLEQLSSGGIWKGREFFGYTNACTSHSATRFYFRQRSNGIAFGFSPEEWNDLRGTSGKFLDRLRWSPSLRNYRQNTVRSNRKQWLVRSGRPRFAAEYDGGKENAVPRFAVCDLLPVIRGWDWLVRRPRDSAICSWSNCASGHETCRQGGSSARQQREKDPQDR